MKKHFTMLISGLLCIIILFSSCSTSTDDTNSNASNSDSDKNYVTQLTLAFSSGDSLNPYKAKTKENQEISTLLFDPLINVDSKFNVEYKLASSIVCDGLNCLIKLKNARCANGMQITAEDVKYTLSLILSDRENAYYEQLSNIYSYSVSGNDTVNITLETSDPYFINNLDFPIIQKNSSDLKDENNRQLPPNGCGRYTLVNDNGNYYLEPNKYYYNEINCTKINLLNCPDNESLEHASSVGNIDCIYSDLSNNFLPYFTGNRKRVNLNNLVYLGLNSENSYLSNTEFRQIVSCALNRTKIVEDAYFNYASVATGLFNPEWKEAENFVCFEPKSNFDKSIAYFKQLGYNEKDSNGYLFNSKGKRIKLKLLYNSDNSSRENTAKVIYGNLIKCGIDVDLTGVKYSEYVSMLENGNYDMYIGEVRISQSMNLYDIFNDGDIIYGIKDSSKTKESFVDYYNGEGDLGLCINNFNDELPFIPICYRYGVVICNEDFKTSSLNSSPNSVYNGIENILAE